MASIQCAISGKTYDERDGVRIAELDANMQQFVQSKYPHAQMQDFIGDEQVIRLKKAYLEQLLTDELGELDQLDKNVIDSISANKLLAEKIEDSIDEQTTKGERIADAIADFGGSWTFIIAFFSFILIWIGINLWLLGQRTFDPYPFILLNLILSCLAAVQAPIIMMSQNRQEAKDRRRSEYDYKINLKAELEIQMLHKKIDHLLVHQNKRLLEIQMIQGEMLQAILERLSKEK